MVMIMKRKPCYGDITFKAEREFTDHLLQLAKFVNEELQN